MRRFLSPTSGFEFGRDSVNEWLAKASRLEPDPPEHRSLSVDGGGTALHRQLDDMTRTLAAINGSALRSIRSMTSTFRARTAASKFRDALAQARRTIERVEQRTTTTYY